MVERDQKKGAVLSPRQMNGWIRCRLFVCFVVRERAVTKFGKLQLRDQKKGAVLSPRQMNG
jgi:hypothetical protein